MGAYWCTYSNYHQDELSKLQNTQPIEKKASYHVEKIDYKPSHSYKSRNRDGKVIEATPKKFHKKSNKKISNKYSKKSS
eukprot:UN12661